MGFLKNLFGGSEGGTPKTLGSESDLIRQLLFASQSLEEQVMRFKSKAFPSPFQSISDAHKLVIAGKKLEAVGVLRDVLELPQLETRTVLWVWSGLRELGEKPESKWAFEVLGVVVEVPSGGAYDTLAAYVDGSARYLNFSGKAIFWDAPDPQINQLCLAMVGSSFSPDLKTKSRTNLALPKSGTQSTLLTRSGPFVTIGLAPNLLRIGGALVQELIKRASVAEGTSGSSSMKLE